MSLINKKTILWLSGIFILAFLTVYFAGDEFLTFIRQLNIENLLILILLQLTTLTLTTYQWYYLLRKKSSNIHFKDVMLIYLSGKFVESVTPSAKFGGEASKVYLFNRKTDLDYKNLSSVMFLQKYIMIIPFLFLCLLTIFLATYQGYILPDYIYTFVITLTLSLGIITGLYYILKKFDLSTGRDQNYILISEFIEKLISKFKDFCINFIYTFQNTNKSYLLLISLIVWTLYARRISGKGNR